MGGVYFADTFYWIALAEPKDTWHSRALAWQSANPNARFVTTDEVLAGCCKTRLNRHSICARLSG